MLTEPMETITLNEERPDHKHLLDVGSQALNQCRWQDAITAFRQIREEAPLNIDVEGNLAFSLSQARQYEEAIEVLKQLALKEPRIARWPYMVGYQFYMQGRWGEAVTWFDKALSLRPGYMKALYRKGYAHLQKDEHDEGVVALHHCIKSWDQLPSDRKQNERKYYGKANFQLGKAYLNKGLSLKARRPLEIAVQIDSNDHNRLYALGKCHLKNDYVNDAIREFKKANVIKPGTDYVLDGLAQAYVVQGELNRSENLYLSIPPGRRRSFVLKNLGAIQLEQGKVDKATETLRRAASKDASNHNIQLLLGKSLEACGQKDSARQTYMRAIDLRRQKYGLDFPEAQDRLLEVEETLMTSAVFQQSDSNCAVSDNVGLHEHEGVVNHYNSSRGFGFINSSEQKVFFHISAVEDGHTPGVGKRVKFVMEQSEKGPRAIRVTFSQISCAA